MRTFYYINSRTILQDSFIVSRGELGDLSGFPSRRHGDELKYEVL